MTPSEPPRAAPPEAALLSRPHRRWYAHPWFWVVVVIVVVAAGFWSWRAHRAGDAPVAAAGGYAGKGAGKQQGGKRGGPMGPNDVMPVGVATVKQGDVPIYVAGLGSVTPVNTVTVKPRVDGQLVKLNFREGQIVKAGEVLAEIDPRPFQVVVTQAEGTFARDQALLANAKVDFDRYTTLVRQDSLATQQLDTQKSLVSQLDGTVRSDRGSLDSAKLQLSYTKVVAPVGGRIGLKQVDVGNMVHASDTTGIVVITQLQPIDVVFPVPEANVQRIMKRLVAGSTMAVDAFDRDSKTLLNSGTLVTADNQIDVTTGTVRLKARFANAAYDLFPNQFVNARLLLDVQRGAIVIPPAAIQRGAQGFYVYVVKGDNTVTARGVKPGISQGDQAAIESGLQVGEVVVVDGTDKLREDAKVDPVARDGKAVAAPTNLSPDGKSPIGGTPEERERRWQAVKKRIDAGEFGEDIKKLPEDQQKAKMQEMRRARGGGGGGGGGGPGGPGGGGPP